MNIFSNCYIGFLDNTAIDIKGLKDAVSNLKGSFNEVKDVKIQNINDLKTIYKNPNLAKFSNNLFDPLNFVNFIKLPVHPAEFTINGGEAEFEESQGLYNKINIPRTISPIEISFEALFTKQTETFTDLVILPVFEYIKIINSMKAKKLAIRLVLTNKNGLNINLKCWIRQSTIKKMADGDIQISFIFREAQEPNVISTSTNNMFYKPTGG